MKPKAKKPQVPPPWACVMSLDKYPNCYISPDWIVKNGKHVKGWIFGMSNGPCSGYQYTELTKRELKTLLNRIDRCLKYKGW